MAIPINSIAAQPASVATTTSGPATAQPGVFQAALNNASNAAQENTPTVPLITYLQDTGQLATVQKADFPTLPAITTQTTIQAATTPVVSQPSLQAGLTSLIPPGLLPPGLAELLGLNTPSKIPTTGKTAPPTPPSTSTTQQQTAAATTPGSASLFGVNGQTTLSQTPTPPTLPSTTTANQTTANSQTPTTGPTNGQTNPVPPAIVVAATANPVTQAAIAAQNQTIPAQSPVIFGFANANAKMNDSVTPLKKM